jgi:hypothetical protein
MSGQPLSKRLLTALLGLFVLGATIAPPLLDAGERPGEVRVESEHDPAQCAVLHDHAACAQLAKSFATAGGRSASHVRVALTTRRLALPDRLEIDNRAFSPAASPRAPPVSRI